MELQEALDILYPRIGYFSQVESEILHKFPRLKEIVEVSIHYFTFRHSLNSILSEFAYEDFPCTKEFRAQAVIALHELKKADASNTPA